MSELKKIKFNASQLLGTGLGLAISVLNVIPAKAITTTVETQFSAAPVEEVTAAKDKGCEDENKGGCRRN